MSEEQTKTATASADKTQEPDDTGPAPARQAELRAAYERNLTAGRPPCAGVEIRTRGELNWIKRERGWSGDPERQAEVIDLREADLSGANLKGANLSRANLSGATLLGADLRKVTLTSADLSGSTLRDADLRGAVLVGSNLSGATLTSAKLSAAALNAVNLSGATVRTDLSGANLTSARMDGTTILGTFASIVPLDTRTRLLDVVWNGANLATLQWENMPRLGDEGRVKAAKTRQDRIKALTDATRAYRGLAQALQAQGLTDDALRYRTRQYQLERQTLWARRKFGSWVFSSLLNLVSGYGDRPGRALACYLAVVGIFAALYDALTNGFLGFITSHTAALQWYEALVLSISSFHGRGFFPSVPSLGDPIAIVAAAEAIIGLFIELVFIATFTQRFFSR